MSSGKATTISVSSNGEVQIHLWNPSNGILVEEVTLNTLINVETLQSAFINEGLAYIVESRENGIEIQSYDIKTGKEAGVKAKMNGMQECVSTQSLLVCLSKDKRSIHYKSLPLEDSDLNQLEPNSISESSIIEKISAVDNTNSITLRYSSGTSSNLMLLSLVDGRLSETKLYKR